MNVDLQQINKLLPLAPPTFLTQLLTTLLFKKKSIRIDSTRLIISTILLLQRCEDGALSLFIKNKQAFQEKYSVDELSPNRGWGSIRNEGNT